MGSGATAAPLFLIFLSLVTDLSRIQCFSLILNFLKSKVSLFFFQVILMEFKLEEKVWWVHYCLDSMCVLVLKMTGSCAFMSLFVLTTCSQVLQFFIRFYIASCPIFQAILRLLKTNLFIKPPNVNCRLQVLCLKQINKIFNYFCMWAYFQNLMLKFLENLRTYLNKWQVLWPQDVWLIGYVFCTETVRVAYTSSMLSSSFYPCFSSHG